MSNNIENEYPGSWKSFIGYIVWGYIILLTFLLLCRYTFFPFNSFYLINRDTFDQAHYNEDVKFFLIVYPVYSVIVTINFAMRNFLVFQKIQKFCARFMAYYAEWILLCTVIVFLYRFRTGNCFRTGASFAYVWSVWDFFTSSAIASLFLVPLILLIFLLSAVYRLYIKKVHSKNESSELITETKTTLAPSESRQAHFSILSKQSINMQFIYWYAILVLWGVALFFSLVLWFHFAEGVRFFVRGGNRGGGGWGGGMFISFLEEGLAFAVSLTLGYFIFGIVMRRILSLLYVSYRYLLKKE